MRVSFMGIVARAARTHLSGLRDRMLFTKVAEALTISGLAMPAVTLTRSASDRHRYSATDRDAYTGIIAYCYDKANAERQLVIAGSDDDAEELRPTYASRTDACRQSRMAARAQRGEATYDFTLDEGRVDILPESPLTARGFKPDIDATPWLVKEVVDSLDDNSFGTRVQCEVKGEEF
ncbi:hypothetical protein [Chromohalobacter sp.]|uniref:hypothetical protein n=1 Tax=Chromohalobacter TaxID=42054 RepID=UPI001DC26026|nr:hypothetical protein [Chromohalobacter sp.]NQY44640.1 hypothetical protein [Chromohalobacter sp.]